MFEFLGLGKNKGDHDPSTMAPTVQLSATQIDMVRMTLLDVLRLHGIPGTWLRGEVVPVNVPAQGEALLLQLDVKHWHDAFVLHAMAFQQAMLDGLARYDPEADAKHYLFSWKFSEDCGCPHLYLPKGDFWRTSARTVITPTPAPKLQPDPPVVRSAPRVDIDTGPASLQVDMEDDDDHGFAPTQIRDDR